MSFNANDGFVIKSPVNASLNVDDTGNIIGIDTIDSSIIFASIIAIPHAQIISPTPEQVANTGVLYRDTQTQGLFYSNGFSLVSTSSGPAGGASLGAATPLPLAATAAVGTSIAAAHEDHVHALPDVFGTTKPGLVPQASSTPSATKFLNETGSFSDLPTVLTGKTISGSNNTLTNLPAGQITGVIPMANLAFGTPDGTKFLRDDGTLQPVSQGNASMSSPLSQFAPTTSAQLASVLLDETGTGSAVFSIMPVLVSPLVGTQLANDNSSKAASTNYVKNERTTLATLQNKTIDGNDNFLTNLPAARISGVIPMANLATGTPTGAKFLRDDGTLQLIPGGGNAMTASPLSQFAATTSAQLRGVMTDETGTGNLVFSNGPTLVAPVLGAASATSLVTSTPIGVTSGGSGINVTIPFAPIFGGTSPTSPFQSGSPGFPGQVLTSNGSGALPSFEDFLGSGDALTTNGLGQFSTTTSAELAGIMSDETGSGSLVFATNPTLVTPDLGVATATSVNKVNITTPLTSATLTIADGKTLTASNTLTLSGTDGSAVALRTGGTVGYASDNLGFFSTTTSAQLRGIISDETGSGSLVFSDSPTLVSPTLGNASATTLSLTAPLSIPSGGIGKNSLTPFAPVFGGTTSTSAVQSGTLGTAGQVLTSNGAGSLPTFQAPTGGGDAFVANPLSQFAPTTSAQLRGVISDETGTGSLVFATSPTLVTPTLGVASATSLNKVTVTAPATGSTLTIVDGKTLTASSTVNLTGTDGVTVNYGAGGNIVYTSANLSVFAGTTSAQLAGVISDETGSGSLVFSNSPTLVTPAIGNASGTSLTLATPLPVSSGGVGSASLTAFAPLFGGTTSTSPIQSGTVGSFGDVLTSNGPGSIPTFQPAPGGGGNALTSNPLSQFAATTSAQLRGIMSDETGTGALVFSVSPTLVTPNLGVANATSINKVSITAPATGSTLTIADTRTLTVATSMVLSSNDGVAVNFGAGGDAVMTSNNLGIMSATTSAQLANVMTDETGTGSLVFSTSPTLITPILGAASATSLSVATPISVSSGGLGVGTMTPYSPIFAGTTTTGPTQTGDPGTLGQVLTSNGPSALPTFKNPVGGGGDALVSNPLSQFAPTTSSQLAGVITDETGTGSLVFSNSPVLVTPTLGSATATSLALSAPLSVTSGGNGLTSFTPYAPIFGGVSSTSALQSGTPGASGQVLTSNGPSVLPTFQTPATWGNAQTANPLSQFAATTSAQLAGVISDETGTGSLVFANSPTLVTPNLGVASATSLTLGSQLTTLNGGTGATNFTAYGPVFGGTVSTGALQSTGPGTLGQVLMSNGPGALPTFQTASGGGNAQTANPLSQFAATTSAQLASIITDETGTGSLVFSASPTLTGTPQVPTAAAGTNTPQIASTAHVFAERTNVAALTNKTLVSPVINTPTGLVKSDVGLSNVDNTSDAVKNAAGATLTNKVINGANNSLAIRIADLTDTSTFFKTLMPLTSATAVLNALNGVAAGTTVTTLTAGANIMITGTSTNPIISAVGGGGGSGNIDGGMPTSIFGGTFGIDGGTPTSIFAGSLDGGAP